MCEVVFLNFWLCPNILALSNLNFLSLEGACHSLPPESLSNLTAVFRAKFPPFLMGPFILMSFLNHSPDQTPLLPRAWFYCSQQFLLLFFLISSLKAGIHSSLSCGLSVPLVDSWAHSRSHLEMHISIRTPSLLRTMRFCLDVHRMNSYKS